MHTILLTFSLFSCLFVPHYARRHMYTHTRTHKCTCAETPLHTHTHTHTHTRSLQLRLCFVCVCVSEHSRSLDRVLISWYLDDLSLDVQGMVKEKKNLVQEKIHKFASHSWLKGKYKKYKLALISSYRHPDHASEICTHARVLFVTCTWFNEFVIFRGLDEFVVSGHLISRVAGYEIHTHAHDWTSSWYLGDTSSVWYGVATISRLLKIIGLFCRIKSLL